MTQPIWRKWAPSVCLEEVVTKMQEVLLLTNEHGFACCILMLQDGLAFEDVSGILPASYYVVDRTCIPDPLLSATIVIRGDDFNLRAKYCEHLMRQRFNKLILIYETTRMYGFQTLCRLPNAYGQLHERQEFFERHVLQVHRSVYALCPLTKKQKTQKDQSLQTPLHAPMLLTHVYQRVPCNTQFPCQVVEAIIFPIPI